MARRPGLVFSGIIIALSVFPGDSLFPSLQWPTEGSYVHQIAHLLFFGAMLFFIREIYQAGLQKFRGFHYLIWCWLLLALWNLDAFIGHWADWSLRNPVILGRGFSRQILMENFHTWLFYITKIDHFILLVPAFYLFYRGLKALAQKTPAEYP
jgi:hypothetical protein